ncbi:hypothetical protein CFK38_03285 [Brachybacterium vulturis]|uniref:DUF4232 domain-containing protein n=1 Tax=Brachybacterium vulturis TaxID=2017484 RepID=A0A291GJY8_9MICO|nr:DUF4232 domain-containing protein [Brachybacterium vulturis]ATG50649.1 hypothetical protein CFK38_03285 [Brachybacterium vulturis]
MARPAPLRHLPAPGVVAAALVLAGFAVLLVVGVWASRLGAPPEWSFDCNDTTCIDLWAEARRRYLGVTVLAGIVVLLGAVLGSLAVPRSPVPRRSTPGPGAPLARRAQAASPALLRLVALMLLAAALLWVAGWAALALSRPSALAVALAALLLAVFAAWRWLRPGAESDRGACWVAAVGTMAPVAVGALMLTNPVVLLGTVLLIGSPLLGVPAIAGVLLGGTALMGRLLPRIGEPGHAVPAAVPPAVPARVTGDDAVENGPAPRRASRPMTIAAVMVITVLAVVIARPVPAPPADAWLYTDTAEGVGTGADATAPERTSAAPAPEAGSGRTGGAVPPSEEDTAPAAPVLEAAGLPSCSPESLRLVAAGWDSVSGDSAVTLRATNIGTVPCALQGAPRLTLDQGGEEIALRPEPLAHLAPAVRAADGIGLAPGDTARSRLYWPGYRTAADQRTPQQLTVRIGASEGASPVAFAPTPSGHDPGPAPFDLKAGVEGGAVIEVGPWETDPGSAG